MATREQTYTAQLRDLGVWQDAFRPEIHTLAIMERDLQRALKLWRAAGSELSGPDYRIIAQLRRDILAHRNALGLTPAGLRRLKAVSLVPQSGTDIAPPTPSNPFSELLDELSAHAADG